MGLIWIEFYGKENIEKEEGRNECFLRFGLYLFDVCLGWCDYWVISCFIDVMFKMIDWFFKFLKGI